MKRMLALLLALVLCFGLVACGTAPIDTTPVDSLPLLTEPVESAPLETEPLETQPIETEPVETEPALEVTEEPQILLDPDGWYYSAEEVALYLVTYGELPANFITKSEARTLGREGGSVPRY